MPIITIGRRGQQAVELHNCAVQIFEIHDGPVSLRREKGYQSRALVHLELSAPKSRDCLRLQFRFPLRPQTISVDRKRGQRKEAASKTVTKCQQYFSTLSNIFRAGQTTSKIVKNIFRHFSTIFARHQFSGPFWNGSDNRAIV